MFANVKEESTIGSLKVHISQVFEQLQMSLKDNLKSSGSREVTFVIAQGQCFSWAKTM